jgi:predicted CXXCH cytochrome family protein
VLATLSVVAVSPPAASADPSGPHTTGGPSTDTCAACHRIHSGGNDTLLGAVSQTTLCFTCHDGTGSMYNVSSEYSDPDIPPNDPVTSSFYSHVAPVPSTHTSARQDEFAGVLNRHAECADCHNPHSMSTLAAAPTGSGWLASGSLDGTAGVAATAPLTWKDPLVYEYELCLKCHSDYTQLLSYAQPSQQKKDKAADTDPASASFHPLRAPGTNTTTAMENSLAGGSLWQFTSASTIRCVNCHANSGLLAGAPASDGKLAPHASQNRSLLIANYRDRTLKPDVEAYSAADFELCYLCHSAAPFASQTQEARTDTNFRLHGFHMTSLLDAGGGPGSIDTPGAGPGNALCAECHFQLHSTRLAPYAGNQNYQRGVNFAPNVQPRSGLPNPQWSGPASRTCTLVCHGEDHNGDTY